MQIVPVLDLCKGIVVHAVKGNRKEYRAINSALSSSPKPLDVISDFLKVYRFKSIYIADLDALEQQGNNVAVIESICARYPDIEVWLDTGFTLVEHYLQNLNSCNLRLILSSESLPSTSSFASLINHKPPHNFILSLDYKADKLLSNFDLLQIKQQWPKDIIVLNLNQVGAEHGFQFPEGLNQLELEDSFNIYYGGGIRDSNDIRNLNSQGLSGALVSTALHNQDITGEELRSIIQLP